MSNPFSYAQAPVAANPFAGMNHATMSQKRPYLTEGNYRVRIDRMLFKATRGKGDALIAEVTVVESDNPAHPVGSQRSWYQSFADKDIGGGAAREFTLAVLGYNPMGDPASFAAVDTETALGQAVDVGNTFAGREVLVACMQIMTKRNTPFTKHAWSPVAAGGAPLAAAPTPAAPPPAAPPAPKGQWNGTMFVIPGPNGTWIQDPNGGR